MYLLNSQLGGGGGLNLSTPGAVYDSNAAFGNAARGLLAPLDTSKALLLVSPDAGGLDASVLEVGADWNISAGTKQEIEASGAFLDDTQRIDKGYRLDDTHALVSYNKNDRSELSARIIETDGSNGINTVGSANTLSSGSAGGDANAIASKAALIADDGADSTIQIATLSGTSITGGTAVTAGVGRRGSIAMLSATLAIVANENGRAYPVTISGTTPTVGTSVAYTTGSFGPFIRVVRISDTQALILWQLTSPEAVKARLVTYSGGVLTVSGSVQTISNTVGTLAGFDAHLVPNLSVTRVIFCWHDTSGDKKLYARVMEINGTSFTFGSVFEVADGVSGGNPATIVALAANRAIINYGKTSGDDTVFAHALRMNK